ncbi:MAG: efflux RND transporter periplasmic adaptor subunit [Brachymonas denitrificans]|uniref:HlyD family secretion protein n=1 Tax=Brachymonas denitrificans TaxID=28220 RepID=UPI001BCD26C3|nr:biotin/lipoyl-binding protein [Brachymonas denitrificans]
MQKTTLRKTVLALALLAVAGTIGYGLWRAAVPPAVVLQGQMEAQETDVAPKVAGRIGEVLVREGQQVRSGDALIRMDSPEIEAKVAQAQAARDAASAVARKAANGARPQEVEMARANWQRAQAAADLASKSWQRVDRLAREGLVAAQKRDEAYANFVAARDQATAARAQYDLAVAGARSEDRAAANAQERQVAAVVAEARVAQSEAALSSPVAGEVAKVYAKVGEIAPQGVPVVTVVDLQDQWLVLNVREDRVQRFAIGSQFEGSIPALKQDKVVFKVTASSVLPDFATWRATRSDQGFDMRTFEIKARPLQPIAGVRPGMSVLVQP